MNFDTKRTEKLIEPIPQKSNIDNTIVRQPVHTIKKKVLTNEEKDLLKQIMDDKYSVGSFCGMVTNLYFDGTCTKETIIQEALHTRLLAEKLARE